jgi:hypothetical protein
MKNASMSAFTRKFAKETNKLMGNPTNRAKLTQLRINKAEDYVTFIWLTERTPKYPDNFNAKVVEPTSMSLENGNLYTIEIRVLDFFKLLETTPGYPNVTDKDIEEVFLNCDIKVWSDVPAFQFQGMNFNMTQFDAAIYPEHRPPNHWNKYHGGNQLLDKHAAGIVNGIKFFIPMMRQMIKKYLDRNSK